MSYEWPSAVNGRYIPEFDIIKYQSGNWTKKGTKAVLWLANKLSRQESKPTHFEHPEYAGLPVELSEDLTAAEVATIQKWVAYVVEFHILSYEDTKDYWISHNDEPFKASDMDVVGTLFGTIIGDRRSNAPGRLVYLFIEDDENYFLVQSFDEAWLPDLAGVISDTQSKADRKKR